MRTAPNGGAVAEEKADKDERLGQTLDSPPPASASSPQQQALLDELDEHRDRCEVNAKIVAWIFELQGRLWKAEAHLLHDDCRRHLADLASEIERLKLCISLAKKMRDP